MSKEGQIDLVNGQVRPRQDWKTTQHDVIYNPKGFVKD